ncbi:MAG: alpha/beta hydrolase [Acidobacteriota bacterium]
MTTGRREFEVRVGGAPIHVETHVVGDDERIGAAGSSRHVLMLHGNPDCALLWHPMIDHLRDAIRDTGETLVCVTPDLPGFARSGMPADHDASLPAMARWVDALLDALGIDGAIDLVGHDFGGVYAAAWAVEHPERVRSIALLDTFFHTDHRWHFWARVWRTPVLGELSMALFRWPLFRWEMRRGSPRLDDAHLRTLWRFVTPSAKRAVLRLYRACDPEVFVGWEERLRRLVRERPSLVIWGADDPYLPAARADSFDAQQVVVLDECGHWPPVEEPRRVAAELARLLAAS